MPFRLRSKQFILIYNKQIMLKELLAQLKTLFKINSNEDFKYLLKTEYFQESVVTVAYLELKTQPDIYIRKQEDFLVECWPIISQNLAFYYLMKSTVNLLETDYILTNFDKTILKQYIKIIESRLPLGSVTE